MLPEATEELALISPADAAHPDVLGVRIELHTEKKQWDFVIGYGEQLARRHPDKDTGWIAWAYALRELNRVEEAKAVLTFHFVETLQDVLKLALVEEGEPAPRVGELVGV